MFAETITQSAARFADVYFFAYGTGKTVDTIDGYAREMIGDGNSLLKSGILFPLEIKGRVLHRTRAHLSVLLTRKLLMFYPVCISAVVGSC